MRYRRRRRRSSVIKIVVIAAAIILAGVLAAFAYLTIQKNRKPVITPPEERFAEYGAHVAAGEYEAIYDMLSAQSHLDIGKEEFISRYEKIYGGIEAEDIRTQVTSVTETEDGQATVEYEMTMNSVAGPIEFYGQARFCLEASGQETAETSKPEEKYMLEWRDKLIFPGLGRNDKVRVSTDKAARGRIYDRNGNLLAGEGTAASVGLVPGKMREDRNGDLAKMAELLDMTPETIEKKLSASWVKDDSFVPVKNLKKVDEQNLVSLSPREENVKNKELQDELLTIPGVMISSTAVRSYPMGEAGAHLTGYVQKVTAEDLEKHPGEGYLNDSVIGRSGMEVLYEKELKGTNGCSISILDPGGEVKETVAAIPRVDGTDITLTIDSGLQSMIYDAFREDKSCTVAMNPYTGEILALVSTPSYDDNDFILGMSERKWNSLNEDERKPMYNRFRQKFAPGSSFKSITAALGLEAGTLKPDQDMGSEGLSWKKDDSWGNYSVTTLHDYSPVTMENAFIYSDNIYFAKAALALGSERFEKGLDRLGFGEKLPFEISVAESQYSNGDHIESEIQLADSGYGQGQVLMNPVHLAALYTMFLNHGNVMKPYLRQTEDSASSYWLPEAVSAETADRIHTALLSVVNSPNGTGRAAKREDILLAGKTGTAEIKASKEDTTGTELGWFAVYTADPNTEKPILLVTMTEDVKGRGGSGYVVNKIKSVEGYIPSGM